MGWGGGWRRESGLVGGGVGGLGKEGGQRMAILLIPISFN